MGWKPKVKANIANSIDITIMDEQHDNLDIKVFMDGSGMEGKIGTAAVLYRNRRVKTRLWYRLDSKCHHMVYEGERVGAILGTKLISKEWGIWSAIIYIDNQASIMATQLTKPNPGHYIFNTLHKNIEALKIKHCIIHLAVQWIPGHKGVDGNEQADKQAKKAIMEGSSDTQELPKILRKMLPHSKSMMQWAFTEKLKHNAQKHGKNCHGGTIVYVMC
jgi:ribonuclease HI